MKVIAFDELESSAGSDLGVTDFVLLDQPRIDGFAELTEDRQWIHTDAARAEDGPFGATIAHGFLTLSLLSHFLEELLEVPDSGMAINYGLNKVRFPSPVPAGTRVRAAGEIVDVSAVSGGHQVVLRMTVSGEDQPKPACVADFVIRYLAAELDESA